MSDSSAPPPQTPGAEPPQDQSDATAAFEPQQPTEPLAPQVPPGAAEAVAEPDAAQAQYAPVPSAGAPAGAAAPFGSPPPGVPGAGFGLPVPPRRGIRGLWREATSTTGGRVATIIAAVFAAVVVVGAVGLGASAIGRMGGDDRRAVGPVQANRGQGGRPGQGPGQGLGQGPGMGQGRRGFGDGPGGDAARPGQDGGLGLMPGLGTLGNVLHGELVTGGSSGTTILYQVGTVTAYTKGSSLAVKSSDGFAASYQVNSNSHLVGNTSTGITVGDTVRVIATKDGPTVSTVQIVGRQGSSTDSSNGTGA